jgi:hypothetical protein
MKRRSKLNLYKSRLQLNDIEISFMYLEDKDYRETLGIRSRMLEQDKKLKKILNP